MRWKRTKGDRGSETGQRDADPRPHFIVDVFGLDDFPDAPPEWPGWRTLGNLKPFPDGIRSPKW